MKDSILIFGAGINQLTLIKSAKELDLSTIVLDPNVDAPGKNISDFFYSVKGNDYKTTKGIAIKHKVKGIVTSQMEKPMRLMAKLAQELGFIFHSPEVIERSLDKWLMKQSFISNKVPCAQGVLIKKDEIIQSQSLNILNFPLILKPKDSTSSQGVYKIDQFKDIEKYLPITLSFSKSGEVIIEEFLDGPEFSIEAITYKGKTKIVQFTEKFVTSSPRTVEMGHLQPASLTEEQKSIIIEVVIKAINAIGIDNSASHTEIKLTKKGPKIIEIGARLGGDFISSYLTQASCGVNMDKAAIQVALGFKPDLKHKWGKYSFIKYLELYVGKKIIVVGNWKEILNEPGVLFAHINVKPGDIISEITNSAKRPGFVIVDGDNKRNVLRKSKYYVNVIKSNIKIYKEDKI